MPTPTTSIPTAAIIGAGMAGLGAARTLKQAGYHFTVFESAPIPGGRVATLRIGDLVFDSGAQNIRSEGTAFETEALEVLGAADIIDISAPICLHENGKILLPDATANAARKWSCRGGMARLAESFAAGLDVRYNTPVERIRKDEGRFILLGRQGESLGAFEYLICSLPAPQTATLFRNSESGAGVSSERLALLEQVEYNRCMVVLLHFEAVLDVAWYALLARDRSHPLLWLARENAKAESFVESGASLVAQLGPAASDGLWTADEVTIVGQSCGYIAELLGSNFLVPQTKAVHRWPCAQPRKPASFDLANPAGSRLVFCGDGVSAARVPDAYESGMRAAQYILSLQSP